MRISDIDQPTLSSTSFTGDFVSADYFLRRIHDILDTPLDSVQGNLTVVYSHTGLSGIAPEKLI